MCSITHFSFGSININSIFSSSNVRKRELAIFDKNRRAEETLELYMGLCDKKETRKGSDGGEKGSHL